MKTNRIITIVAAFVAALSLFASCKMGGENPSNSGQTAKNARVSLSIPQRSRDRAVSVTGERAIGYIIDRVVLTALDDQGTEVAKATFDFADSAITGDIVMDVPSGIRIRIKADVYNLSMDGASPNVSGTSDPFAISPGDQTTVNVTCFPVAPITVGTQAQELSIGTDVNNLITGVYYPSNDEKWLKVVTGAGPSTTVSFDTGRTTAPDLKNNFHFKYEAFDESGRTVEIGYSQKTATGFQLIIEGDASKTFYIYPYFVLETRDSAITGARETQCLISKEAVNLNDDEFEPNNSVQTASPIELDTTYDLMLQDDDWFKITITDNSTLFLTCACGEDPLDAMLVNSDGSVSSHFTKGPVEAGTCYVHVFGDAGPCAYQLRCELIPDSEDAFGNDSAANARDLSLVTAEETYFLGSTADWFVVHLDDPCQFEAMPSFLYPESGDSYTATLYDSAMNVLRGPTTYDATRAPNSGINEELFAGDYYVKFEAAASHLSYNLNCMRINLDFNHDDSLEPNNTSGTASVIANCGNSTNTSTDLLKLADDDWFSYNGGTGSYLYVDFSVVAAMAPEVTIYDADSNVLYDKKLPRYEYIPFNFTAGTRYYIRVRPIWATGEGIVNDIVQYKLSLY